jgi:hypothetical protein
MISSRIRACAHNVCVRAGAFTCDIQVRAAYAKALFNSCTKILWISRYGERLARIYYVCVCGFYVCVAACCHIYWLTYCDLQNNWDRRNGFQQFPGSKLVLYPVENRSACLNNFCMSQYNSLKQNNLKTTVAYLVVIIVHRRREGLSVTLITWYIHTTSCAFFNQIRFFKKKSKV